MQHQRADSRPERECDKHRSLFVRPVSRVSGSVITAGNTRQQATRSLAVSHFSVHDNRGARQRPDSKRGFPGSSPGGLNRSRLSLSSWVHRARCHRSVNGKGRTSRVSERETQNMGLCTSPLGNHFSDDAGHLGVSFFSFLLALFYKQRQAPSHKQRLGPASVACGTPP